MTDSPTPNRQQVHLPPHRSSDFVIHYRNTDYHCHSFVLQQHSAYFRTYFDALQPLTQVQAEEVEGEETKEEVEEDCGGEDDNPPRRKKRKFDVRFQATFTRERTSKCSHPPLVHCIDLPNRCGVFDADEANFLLFLRHLYFASTLHLPPFEPRPSMIDGLSADTPISLSFPTSSTISTEEVHSYARTSETGVSYKLVCDGLLCLFHYFECESALKRCEAVILADTDGVRNTLYWLPLTIAYGLRKAEAKCVRVIREEWLEHVSERLREGVEALTPAMKLRVMEIFCSKAAVSD